MRFFHLVFLVVVLCVHSSLAVAQDEASDMHASSATDLLDLANGAVVLSSTTEYDLGIWSALSVIDGTTETGWASKKGAINNNEFIIELSDETILKTFVFDTNGFDGVGRGARYFELSGSATSSLEGYIQLLSAEAPEGERSVFEITHDAPVRWLKLMVKNNWGASDYTEIMELEAYGEVLSSDELAEFNSIFDTNYRLLRLRQTGRNVEGCYDWDNGRLDGDTDGRVIRFEWREDGPQIGTAILVLTADAQYLNGLYYEAGKLRGVWKGPVVKDDREPKCEVGNANQVTTALSQGGSATLYGIRFDLDSATLRSDSASTLNVLKSSLEEEGAWRITIEGHTDSQGGESYNLDLSARRAAAVKTWLMEKGVHAGRMEVVGKGESEPQADNGTPQGRALNRRVVVRIIP